MAEYLTVAEIRAAFGTLDRVADTQREDAERMTLLSTREVEAFRALAKEEADALRLRLAEVERELLATANVSDQQRERAKRAERERDEARFNYDIARVNYEEARAWLLDAHKSDPHAAAEYEAYVVAGFTLPDAVRAMRSERDDARRVAKRLARNIYSPRLPTMIADINTALAYEVEP